MELHSFYIQIKSCRCFLKGFLNTVLSNRNNLEIRYETLTATTIPSWSEPGSNGNEEVLLIPQNFRNGASPSDEV